jgi:uncharacterized protein YPO0396
MLTIDQYTATIVNLHNNQSRRLKINGNSAIEVHRRALGKVSSLNEEISEIVNSEGDVVFSLQEGFTE